MSEQSNGGPAYVLWTTDDFPGFSKLTSPQQEEVMNALAEVRRTADEKSGLIRPADGIQSGGDGESVCWRGITAFRYLTSYVPELRKALEAANAQRNGKPRLRLRLAVTIGTAMASHSGAAGSPPVEAERLVSSWQCKYVIKKLADSSLVVIVSDHIYEDSVKHWPDELDPKAYASVRVRDKHRESRTAHITAPGAKNGRVQTVLRYRIIRPAVCLAAVAALLLLWATVPGSARALPDPTSSASPTATATQSPSVSPTPRPSASTAGGTPKPSDAGTPGSTFSPSSQSPSLSPSASPTRPGSSGGSGAVAPSAYATAGVSMSNDPNAVSGSEAVSGVAGGCTAWLDNAGSGQLYGMLNTSYAESCEATLTRSDGLTVHLSASYAAERTTAISDIGHTMSICVWQQGHKADQVCSASR